MTILTNPVLISVRWGPYLLNPALAGAHAEQTLSGFITVFVCHISKFAELTLIRGGNTWLLIGQEEQLSSSCPNRMSQQSKNNALIGWWHNLFTSRPPLILTEVSSPFVLSWTPRLQEAIQENESDPTTINLNLKMEYSGIRHNQKKGKGH